MNKRRKRQLISIIATLAMGMTIINPAVYANGLEDNSKANFGDIKVNPEIHYQTLKGWGTSLCWWGNIIGSWGDADYNGNQTPDREEIAELAFSPDYLNLNIVRYNVGGGDKEDTSIKRCEGLVPGWTEDMTGTKDGTGEFNSEAFYAKDTESMSDAGQLWMLEQANKYRSEEKDIINEVFSNSPPYYMTKSGTSTGGWNAENNLKEDCYDDFATYMARATKWIDNNLKTKYGTGVTYVEPMNEPDTNYWGAGSTKQEGCTFAPGATQSEMFRQMQTALDLEGLSDVQITGTDETALWNANNSFNLLDDDVKQNMTTIGAHTYSGNDSERKTLKHTAQSYDKDLWMSEITRGGGAHWEGSHDSMDAVNAKSQSEGIMADLKYMQPSAWIAWLVADSEYECLQTNSNWGLLHAVFEKDGQPVPDYHTNLVDSEGNRKEGVPGEGYWAITKQFYTMMQYSKYLKSGYTMIDIKDENMCAAISPNGDELVIVAQNFGDERTTTVDLTQFKGAKSAQVYQTSDENSCELIETQDLSDNVLDITLPKNSVTTYVIKADDSSAICNIENYSEIVDADVVKPDSEWTADTDKFIYEGSWGESADEFGGGKYTTEANTSVTFTFEGDQAAIYGTKGEEAGKVNISVDGGEAKEVDLNAEGKDGEALIYYTGKLDNTKHTIKITKAEGYEEKLLEINHAKVIHGEFIEYAEEIQALNPTYTVNGVKPVLPEKVNVISNKGNVTEKEVVWNIEGVDFTEDVTLEGTVEGIEEKATIDVKVVAENTAYFIDCNTLDSTNYTSIDTYADLLNEVADKKYEEGSWGYDEEYGAYDGDNTDMYDSGWWAKEGQTIKYTIPLDKGEYKVKFGFKEWWTDSNRSRSMKVYMTQGETREELGTTNTWNGQNYWNSEEFEIKCENSGNVTFEIEKNNEGDPVLSFIQINKVLDTAKLKEVLKKAENVDESKYPTSKVEALEKAVKSGQELLYKASTTQDSIDEAITNIEKALENLETDTGLQLTQEQVEANDYVLYTVNCGTPDVDVLPNPDSERLGLLQSSFDKEFGEDKETGATWGLNAETDYSKYAKYNENATDIGASFVYMSEDAEFDKYKSEIGYSFEVPDSIEGMEEDTYEVTVAFKLPNWDSRLVNVMLEDTTVATDISLEPYGWVCNTYTTKVTDGELNVSVKAPRRSSTKQDPILNYIKVRAVKDTTPEIPNYTSFTGVAGETMYDTNGNQIQAHGGQIQKLTVDGVTKWYWIGEDKTNDYRPCGGIRVYSSEDLYNWKDEGTVLKTMENMEQFETDPYFKELYGNESQEQKEAVFVDLDKNNCVMERPKMLYNEKTGKYVIWFHADGRYPGSDADYGKAKAGVAISDSPTGPFKLLGSYKLNYHDDPNADHGYDGWEGRGSVRDMNLFKDDDGTAYVIYSSEGNRTTFISKLNDEYTALAVDRDEAEEGKDFTRNFVGWSREAPAMFKYKDKYYIINSGCTGWSPNPAQYFVGDSPMGPFESMGDPCTDWGSGTTYDTQSTCVIPVDAENGKFIYMGDRWNSGDLSESRYVWLPIEFQPGNKIAIRRYENWTLDELDGKGLFEVKTEIQKTVSSVEEIEGILPSEVTITYGTDEEKTPVTWEIGEYDKDKIGTVTVTGTLTEKDRTFTHDIHIVKENTKYFLDSGAKESEYYNNAKDVLKDKLLNNSPDQKYTTENHAGYTGVTEEENSENFDIGLHDGRNYIETGWWASKDKNIEYAFDLKAGEYTVSTGFQEWWNANRNMKVTVMAGEEVLAEQEFTLTGSDSDKQINQSFKLEKDETVKVIVSKIEGSDPVLSWIAVLGEETEKPQLDKTQLEAKISEVVADIQATNKDEYTSASYELYKASADKAVEVAQSVLTDENSTQEQVNKAIEDLSVAYEQAKQYLVTIESVLQTGIDENTVEETEKDKYTAESWKVYEEALKYAQSLIGTKPSEEVVNKAIDDLKQAKESLELVDTTPEEVDKSQLENLLNDCKQFKEEDYTKDSWNNYKQALDTAMNVYEKADATQDEVNKTIELLEKAIKELKLKDDSTGEKPSDGGNNNNNNNNNNNSNNNNKNDNNNVVKTSDDLFALPLLFGCVVSLLSLFVMKKKKEK